MYTFPNGKRYIGATKRPLHLRQGSMESGWNRYKNCKLLWEAIQEYGVESIVQDILFHGEATNEEAAGLERYYIAEFRTNASRYSNPSYGYNQTDGGESTSEKHLSDARKDVLRRQMALLGKANAGKHPSEETRRRQSAAK